MIAPLFVAMLLLGGNSLAEEAVPSAAINEEYEYDSWTSAKDINTVEAYEIYLREYANGRHAKFAQAAINKIKKAENPQAPEVSNPAVPKVAVDIAPKLPETVAASAVAATPLALLSAPAPAAVEPAAKATEAKPEPVSIPPAASAVSGSNAVGSAPKP
jgi:hypothetical protein